MPPRPTPRIGLILSLIVTAVGVLLTWAAHSTAAGVTLLVLGAAGVLVSLMAWARGGGDGP